MYVLMMTVVESLPCCKFKPSTSFGRASQLSVGENPEDEKSNITLFEHHDFRVKPPRISVLDVGPIPTREGGGSLLCTPYSVEPKESRFRDTKFLAVFFIPFQLSCLT